MSRHASSRNASSSFSCSRRISVSCCRTSTCASARGETRPCWRRLPRLTIQLQQPLLGLGLAQLAAEQIQFLLVRQVRCRYVLPVRPPGFLQSDVELVAAAADLIAVPTTGSGRSLKATSWSGGTVYAAWLTATEYAARSEGNCDPSQLLCYMSWLDASSIPPRFTVV